MKPLFKEQIEMWKTMGYSLPLCEGTFWVDNTFVKGFTKDGVERKLYKYKVSQDLVIELKPFAKPAILNAEFETWEETIQRLSDGVSQLETESIALIKETMTQYSDYEWWCMTSTGKDSVVLLAIMQKVMPDIKIMFNNTSCDAFDTYRMAKQHSDWVITNPKIGIYDYFKKWNFLPTRFSRMCCDVYKENMSIQYFRDKNTNKLIQVMGVRNSESKARENKEDFVHSTKWDKNWIGFLPIRKWTDIDIWVYILKNDLEINPKYRKGYGRVGCSIVCPFATKSTWVLDKYWYSKSYDRWHTKLTEDFLDNQRWQQLNCTLAEYHKFWNGGLVRPVPNDEVIEEMMKYKGLESKEIAQQYFNKVCFNDGNNIRQKDVLAMNMKMFGRDTTRFLCKKCLMKELGWDKDKWDEMVETFKQQNCKLF